MFRIAIVEDEKSYYETLAGYISQYEKEFNNAFEVTWYKDGMSFVENYHSGYELILMDIEMPYLNGMSAAQEIRSIDQSVSIIFITNMAQYAIKGYEVSALDYVLKPLSYEAFAMKLQKAIRIAFERQDRRSIMLPFQDEMCRIPLKDIMYVEVKSHNIEFHTYEGVSTSTGSLKAVEEKLDSACFARCNSCYLVNLAHVTGIIDNCVVVAGERLKMSRPKKKEFMNKLSEYYAGGGR